MLPENQSRNGIITDFTMGRDMMVEIFSKRPPLNRQYATQTLNSQSSGQRSVAAFGLKLHLNVTT